MTIATGAVYVCGTYINELGILSSLRRAGWSGPVFAVKDATEGTVLADVAGADWTVLPLPMTMPEGLLSEIERHGRGRGPCHVIFSDERFLEAFAARREEGGEFALNGHGPNRRAAETILDRVLFYEHVVAHSPCEVPRTLAGDSADPFGVLGNAVILRPRRTWQGLTKNPRAAVARSRDALARLEEEYRVAGLCPSGWAYQEVLSLAAADNVSVCGWHGERQHYLLTRKLKQHPDEMGNGDVCEICPADPAVFDVTERILSSLAYRGPFEMEFVRDPVTSRLKVIELNPRFWMQNELANRALGDCLVREYLGSPGDAPLAAGPAPRYWVNTIFAASRLLRGEWGILRILLSRDTIRVPTPWAVLRYFPVFVRRRLA